MVALTSHPATTIARCTVQAYRQLRCRTPSPIGPLGAPFNPFDPATVADPAAAYRLLHAHPGVHPIGRKAFALAGYDDVRAGARAHDMLVSGNGVTMLATSLPMLLTLDEPRHGELRRLLVPLFTARRLAALEPMMRRLTGSAIERMLVRPGADAVAELAVPLPITVIATLLGVPASDLDRFHRWSDGVVAGFHADGRQLAQPLRSVAAALAMHHYLRGVYTKLRRNPGDDIISALLTSCDGGSVSDQELFWLSLMLLVAGNETTTNLIGSLLLALAHTPATYERLRSDPGLIDAAIEEALRWGSPVQHLYRTAATDYTVGSTTIPAGSRVLLLFGAANRDPRKFPDPDVFDIDRNPADHLGFGSGIHHCLGAKLARLETRVVLEELLPRVRRLRVFDPIVLRDNPTVHGPEHLFVQLEP
jgi:cytochrome P450